MREAQAGAEGEQPKKSPKGVQEVAAAGETVNELNFRPDFHLVTNQLTTNEAANTTTTTNNNHNNNMFSMCSKVKPRCEEATLTPGQQLQLQQPMGKCRGKGGKWGMGKCEGK